MSILLSTLLLAFITAPSDTSTLHAVTSTRHADGEIEQTPRAHAPEGPREFGSGAVLRYLVLGDSTTVAVGGTYEAGIAVMTARRLAERRLVTMINLGVSGARFSDVRYEQLPRIGDFKPDVVLLDVGANDVTHLTLARTVRKDLREIVRQLRRINPAVVIVATGSADMTTPPRIPRLLRPLAGQRTRAINKVVREESRNLGFAFAPIAERTGPLFKKDPSLFSDDRFHPNDRGYATWVEVINESLDQALAASP